MAPFSRTTILALRASSLVIAIPAIILYSFVLNIVFDERFAADGTGITVLPVIALALSILWNLLASLVLLTTNPNPSFRWVTLPVDLLATTTLITLGVTGFLHDDFTYGDNGFWQDAPWGYGNWFQLDMGAFGLVGLCAIMQFIIAILAFWGKGKASRVDRGLKKGDLQVYPPVYAEKEIHEQFEDDWKSFAESEGSVEKSGKGKVSQV